MRRKKNVLENQKVIIYNASFDQRILRQQCNHHSKKPIDMDSECAMKWYSQYVGDWNDWHNSYTWQKLPGGDHSALGDALATLEVLKEMAGRRGHDLSGNPTSVSCP